MHTLAKLCTAILLKISLGVFILSSTSLYVVGRPSMLKDSLSKANVYSDIVPAVLEAVEDQESNRPDAREGQEDSPFASAEVKEIVKKSITPSVLESQIGGAIDSIAEWAYGNKPSINLTIDLRPIQETLTTNLVSYAQERAQSLPVCDSQQNIPQNADILTVSCRPSEFTLASIEPEVRNALSEVNFLVTDTSLRKDGQPPLEERISGIKNSFGLLKIVTYASGIIFALSVALYIWARLPLRQALLALGRSLLTSGLMLLVPTALTKLFAVDIVTKAATDQPALAAIGMRAAVTYFDAVLSIVLIWAASLSLIGLVLVIVDRKKSS